MLRITHTQTTLNKIYLTDVDDGLPRRTAKRGTGDPSKSEKDGSVPSGVDKSTKPGVNSLKQQCYVPRVKPTDATIAGYIDLHETDRVLMSADDGVIKGHQTAGRVTVVSFTPADVVAPVLTTADLDTPGVGDITITGTGLTSLAPDITSVILTGTAAVTLTQSQITLGGGTVGATSIVIPAALVPGVVVATTSAQIRADNQLSAVVALS